MGGQNFPIPSRCRRLGAFRALLAEASREFVDDTLPVALASSFEPGLGADHPGDPGQNLGDAVEAHVQRMLDLLCRRPAAPPFGSSATRGMYGKAMMLPSARRTPCLRARLSGEPAIGSGMWRMIGAEASGSLAHV